MYVMSTLVARALREGLVQELRARMLAMETQP